VHEGDNNYDATRLHFENLRCRYGNPIIILNLIKVSTLL
jgi:phosphatidylinositol 3,5-bisphosphate 5-phosphatase